MPRLRLPPMGCFRWRAKACGWVAIHAGGVPIGCAAHAAAASCAQRGTSSRCPTRSRGTGGRAFDPPNTGSQPCSMRMGAANPIFPAGTACHPGRQHMRGSARYLPLVSFPEMTRQRAGRNCGIMGASSQTSGLDDARNDGSNGRGPDPWPMIMASHSTGGATGRC